MLAFSCSSLGEQIFDAIGPLRAYGSSGSMSPKRLPRLTDCLGIRAPREARGPSGVPRLRPARRFARGDRLADARGQPVRRRRGLVELTVEVVLVATETAASASPATRTAAHADRPSGLAGVESVQLALDDLRLPGAVAERLAHGRLEPLLHEAIEVLP
jgi:hypothetical protein